MEDRDRRLRSHLGDDPLPRLGVDQGPPVGGASVGAGGALRPRARVGGALRRRIPTAPLHGREEEKRKQETGSLHEFERRVRRASYL